MSNIDNEKIYEKLCAIHHDMGSMESDIKSNSDRIDDVEDVSDGNKTSLNMAKGALALIFSINVLLGAVKVYDYFSEDVKPQQAIIRENESIALNKDDKKG